MRFRAARLPAIERLRQWPIAALRRLPTLALRRHRRRRRVSRHPRIADRAYMVWVGLSPPSAPAR